MATWTGEQREGALDRLRSGEPLADVVRDTGIPKSTVSGWARAEGLDLAALSEAKTREAVLAHQRKWAELRAETANRSGELADRIIATITEHPEALVPTSARDVKDLATAAGILVDKAQVLGGDASDRVELMGVAEHLLEAAEGQAPRLRAVS